MQSKETVKLGLAGVFWDLLRNDDYFDEIQDTDSVDEFCDDVFRNAVGMEGDAQESYYRDRLEAFTQAYAERNNLKVITEEDDRLDLGENTWEMDDFRENADAIFERNHSQE
jgi:hypothetical protein